MVKRETLWQEGICLEERNCGGKALWIKLRHCGREALCIECRLCGGKGLSRGVAPSREGIVGLGEGPFRLKELTPRFVPQNAMSEKWQQKLSPPYRKHERDRDEGYYNGGIASQGRKKDWSSFQDNRGRKSHCYHHDHYDRQLHHREGDKFLQMRDVQEDSKGRYTPYSIRHKRRMKYQDEDQNSFTGGRNRKHRESEMMGKKQDKRPETWFKITILNGRKYEKKWLLDSIQNHCRLPFNPVDFHYVKKWARFFVQNSRIAHALKDVSSKIYDQENQKISIVISKSPEPYSVLNKLQPKEMKELELTMKNRYDVTQKSLDLEMLRFDSDLMHHDIDIFLNRRQCMSAVLQIIEKNFPELLSLKLGSNKLYQLDGLSDIILKVPTIKILDLSKNKLKSMWEVSKIKTLKLEELWLEGNPLCKAFQDQSSYKSAVQDLFPKLLYLDGQKLYQPVVDVDMSHSTKSTEDSQKLHQPIVDVDMDHSTKSTEDGQKLDQPVIDVDMSNSTKSTENECKGSEVMKNQILQFLQQYYMIYDCENRQGLLDAYHDNASFSLSIPFNSSDPSLSGLCKYFKESKNMTILKDSCQRIQLLEHTKQAILHTLCMLPQTQHDLSSFLIDVWVQSETMLCFSVHGTFKEVEDKTKGSVYAFVRTFITVPARNSGCLKAYSSSSMCIMNDELFVRIINNNEIRPAHSTSESTPSCSSAPTYSKEQQDMVQAFSIQSGMNLQWSCKCLQENEWNFIKAGHIFTVLKTEGRIPEEAFKQTQ
ncbi:nuclear RNA export factor 2-like [Sorex fumeus]|uniref:nuclear RNA export factor 2-like n=1 Tax=Sorex fumeus TaxID=62283 RepID=UPI0024ACEE25|nr:nuclear RNA export factor 2-like [Sorex fumeus]